MVARARVVTPDANHIRPTGTNPTGTVLTILDGDVQLSAFADVRGTLDLTVDGTGWDPRYGRSPLQPYGNEIFVERGIMLGGGPEWVSQGYFRIEEVTQQSVPNGPLRITGNDRMKGIADAKLLAPRQFSSGASFSQAFTTLVQEVYPSATIDFNVTDQALGRAMTVDSDRQGFLADLADALGATMFWDYRGHFVVSAIPDPATTAPAFTADYGEGGVLVSAARTVSRTDMYNAVVASGEGADTTTPVTATAYDRDPRSPTYWAGNFGQVPYQYSSPAITNKGQALVAASAQLRKVTGLPYTIDLSMVPHPGLEPLDVVRVEYPGSYDDHIVDTIAIPLTASAAMTGTTRNRLPTITGAY